MTIFRHAYTNNNMNGVLIENAMKTGIPANAAILGTGKINKGLILQVRKAHNAGETHLNGQFKVVAGDIASFISNLRLTSEDAKNVMDTFGCNSYSRFETVASLANNASLMHLDQWSVIV